MPQPSRSRPVLSLVLLVLLSLAWLASAPPALAATITVSTTADELNRNGSCSLREAVRAANRNTRIDSCAAGGSGSDTITLPAGTYVLTIGGNDDDGALGDLDITGTLTITGAGSSRAVIDGQFLHRVFDVRPQATVTLNNLRLRYGFPGPGADGGAILNRGTLTLNNSIVADNRTEGTKQPLTGNGGGIWSSGTLTLKATRVADNITTNQLDSATSRSGSAGSGMYSTGRLLADGSVIASNVLKGDKSFGIGAGLYTSGTATLINTTVEGNAVFNRFGGAGGGIYQASGTLSLRRSTISENRIDTAPGREPGTGYGGGIFSASGQAVVTNTTISGNRASDGAGMHLSGTGSTVIKSSTITGNVAMPATQGARTGAGISGFFEYDGTLRVNNTIIAGNTIDSGAAADCSVTIDRVEYSLIQEIEYCPIQAQSPGNLFGVDALLGPLQTNGGPTRTHALLPGSPAIDSANPAPPTGTGETDCTPRDQRDVARPQDGDANGTVRCDMGAYERQVDGSSGQEVLPQDETEQDGGAAE